jgi:putative tricarboxylic transport membrane protein
MAVDNIETRTGGARPVASTQSVDIAVSLILLALAALLGWDSWRVGMNWAADGPRAGYFPFYLSIMMAMASLYGLGKALITRHEAGLSFVSREQFGRVLRVFVPTFAFCALTEYLGIYVASFLLVAGFMWWIGHIKVWIALLTAFVFSLAMFLTFEVAFNVIMPKGPLEAVLGY